MRIYGIRKIGVVLAAVGMLAACPRAGASLTAVFDLGSGDTGISDYLAPYAHVEVDLTSSTTATITFTSLVEDGNIYLFGDSSSVDINVNATSWTVSGISAANQGTGFSPGPVTADVKDGKPSGGQVDGFGNFNQTFTSCDGFKSSSDSISFTITDKDTGGSWASATDVLMANPSGNYAAAHIFVTSSPANANNLNPATGYASGGVPTLPSPQVPEPTTLLAGALLLLPFGASTMRIFRKNRAA